MVEIATTPTAPPAAPPPAAAPPAASSAPQGATPRPGFIPDSQFDRLDPTEQSKFARVCKGPQGGSEWIERSKLPSESEAATATADTSATAQPAVTVDGKLKVGEYELSADDIAMLMQQKAANDLRATQVPADPSQYKIELPKDFALPAGLDFKFNEADPALAGARAWSHANHLTQDQFGDLLAQYASLEATKEAKFRTDMKAQLDALGVNGTMRVTALETWLRGTVGDDLAKAMKAGMFSAKIVQGLEIIAKKMATQGHGSFRQDGREPNTGGKGPLSSMPDAEYDALSANEKYKISRM